MKNILSRLPVNPMKQDVTVTIDGILYPVLISDEEQALLAAKAAGRPVVGLWKDGFIPSAAAAEYVLEFGNICMNDLDKIVRRQIGKPWQIAKTKRLLIREMTEQDCKKIPHEETDTDEDAIFGDASKLRSYIDNQYRFYEYGIWLIVDAKTENPVGKAGLTDLPSDYGLDCLELGYHIFETYRGYGYAYEACQAILEYAKNELKRQVCVRIDQKNRASAHLAQKLGFQMDCIDPNTTILLYKLKD